RPEFRPLDVHDHLGRRRLEQRHRRGPGDADHRVTRLRGPGAGHRAPDGHEQLREFRRGFDRRAGQLARRGRAGGCHDIATATTNGDSLTANLLDGITGTVFTLGDNAYEMGTAAEYTSYYAPTWGRHKPRTRPVPGNHEYSNGAAPGYFGYFGAAAGDPAKGYYSYNLGDWHIIALNGELDVTPASTEVQWLRNDLALYSGRCTLAYWHAPRFVSGVNITSNPKYQTLWDTLYAYGADVVI